MTTPPGAQVDLTGAFDGHVHTAPDNRPRKHTALELAELAQAAGMAGFAVKSHTEPTHERAAAAGKRFPDLHVYGGITLNAAAGGIDANVVRRVLSAGGRVVWLPTVDGCGERQGKGRGPEGRGPKGRDGGIALTDGAGRVTRELQAVLEAVAEADSVLATGHTAAAELLPVVRAARQAGVRRILVNHPEIFFLRYPVDLQKRARDEGALVERIYPRPERVADPNEDGFDQIAREIREVGVAASVLATDLGRMDLPSPIDGLREMIHELQRRDLDAAQIESMMSVNPLKLFCPRPG